MDKTISRAAAKRGKTKTAYILDALDEKLGFRKSREQKIRDLSGFLSHTEAKNLREALQVHSTRGGQDECR